MSTKDFYNTLETKASQEYPDEVASSYMEYYSSAKKDLEARNLDLGHESALLLQIQKRSTAALQLNWDPMMPPMHHFSVFSSDPPLQSEQAEHGNKLIVPPDGFEGDSSRLRLQASGNGPESVACHSYFGPHIAQHLGFGTVWGPSKSKDCDTPPRIKELLLRDREFVSHKLELNKKSRALMNRNEHSRMMVDSMSYKMLPQHKNATLFHDMTLVSEQTEHENMLQSHRRPWRPPQNAAALPDFHFPSISTSSESREENGNLPWVPEDPPSTAQAEINVSPYFRPGLPNKHQSSSSASILHKTALNVSSTPSKGTTVRPIPSEEYPELPVSSSRDFRRKKPIISGPVPNEKIRSSMTGFTESENDDGTLLKPISLNDTPPIGKSPAAGLETSHTSSTGLSSTGLGSLSRFMETRGVITSSDPATSPYFDRGETNQTNEQQCQSDQARILSVPGEVPFEAAKDCSLALSIINPDSETISANLLLFLSMNLLKTHLRLVRSLEQRPTPPRLIYREYISSSNPPYPDSTVPNLQDQALTPTEADLIIAPTVGIILTTSHALTQVYLPGHQSDDPFIRQHKDITSPLKERVFRLAPRYEILYLLISHQSPAADQAHIHQTKELQITKSTKTSLDSLLLFCTALSNSTTIVPLHIPTLPEKTAEWILTLATKHSLSLSTISHPAPSANVDAHKRISQHVTLNEIIQEEESESERFLRIIGLNPFAARTVLDIIDSEGRVSEECDDEPEDFPIKTQDDENKSALAVFMEMKPSERLARFRGLIGERLWATFHCLV
ncbi:hypothetical protein N7520_007513 [Penicillium odoratum]|uniref:uncharacterized protein n=1 Tax=Penicillium odoratum TaxID=1167516 RepID=UPI0025472DFC|nr:uncharacterized protein N7520_007513 [Penicillium odoratum]KAJ5760357.1 hypothetical protein N7520_007513 [Penicillium odoratum]